MTPALRSAFLVAPSGAPPLLPRTWRGRVVFTEEHVVALLATLSLGGAALGYAARVACGLDARRGNDDAAEALAAACEACPALAAEVARAESEGRARLRVDVVGGEVEIARGAEPRGAPEARRGLGASSESHGAEQEGGEQVHAPQGAAAATSAQGDAWAERGQPGTVRELAARLETERAAEAASPFMYSEEAAARTGNGWIEKSPAARSKRASEATDDGAPDWQRIREDAAKLAPGPMGFVLWQEARLAASEKNFPALSPYSLWAIESFFASLKRWFLLMAGRGFGKSTLTSRLAAVLGMFTARKMAPGPSWVCPLVSVLPVDAMRRLEDVQAIMLHAYLMELDIALGKSTIVTDDAGGNPIAWVSSASTVGNVSGPSSFAALVDEEEKIINGRAGEIVGSLAYTFRSRAGVRGFRVSSAMTTEGTLAGDCAKGPNVTNFVATLGPFLGVAVEGLLAVAAWEERGDVATRRATNPDAAAAIRAHAALLTADSWQIPTWLGHPSIGCPEEGAPWGPGDAAIATRIEAEAVPEKARDGLPPWRYWLRECCSVPTGADALDDGAEWEVLGEEHRNAELMADDRWAGMRDER